jgi:hypothetical protein
MTIRVIIQTSDAGMAANVGGSVNTTYRTIDLEHPILEEFLARKMGDYGHRQVIGVEVVPAPVPSEVPPEPAPEVQS